MANSFLDSLRSRYKDASDMSDQELILRVSELTKLPVGQVVDDINFDIPKSDFVKEVYGAFRQEASNLARIPAALGSESSRRFADREQAAADVYHQTSQAPRTLGEIEWGDPNKGFTNFLGQGIASSLPLVTQFGAAALTGGVGGALLGTSRTASLAARVAPVIPTSKLGKDVLKLGTISYPSSVGAVLKAQEEEGKANLPQALTLGVPYSVFNAISPEGAIFSSAARGYFGGKLHTTAQGLLKGAGYAGGAEFVGEGAQTTIEETAKKFVNPKYEIDGGNILQAALAGGVVGGTLGGVGGGVRGAFYSDPSAKQSKVKNVLGDVREKTEPLTFGVGVGSGAETVIAGKGADEAENPIKANNALGSALSRALNEDAARVQAEAQAQTPATASPDAQQAADAAALQQQQQQAAQQQQQQAAQQLKAERDEIANLFNVQPGKPLSSGAPTFRVGNKFLGDENALNSFLDQLNVSTRGWDPLTRYLAGIFSLADFLKTNDSTKPTGLANQVLKLKEEFQLGGAATKQDVLDAIDSRLEAIGVGKISPKDEKTIERLNQIYNSISGQNAKAYDDLLALIQSQNAFKQQPSKGATNEAQQNVSPNAGVRAVPGEGNVPATENNNQYGPSLVQPLGPGGQLTGPDGQQIGSQPGAGIRSATDGGSSQGLGGSIVPSGPLTQSQVGQGVIDGEQTTGSPTAQNQAQIDAGAGISQPTEEAIRNKAGEIQPQVFWNFLAKSIIPQGKLSTNNWNAKLAVFETIHSSALGKTEYRDTADIAREFSIAPETVRGFNKQIRNIPEADIKEAILESLEHFDISAEELQNSLRTKISLEKGIKKLDEALAEEGVVENENDFGKVPDYSPPETIKETEDISADTYALDRSTEAATQGFFVNTTGTTGADVSVRHKGWEGIKNLNSFNDLPEYMLGRMYLNALDPNEVDDKNRPILTKAEKATIQKLGPENIKNVIEARLNALAKHRRLKAETPEARAAREKKERAKEEAQTEAALEKETEEAIKSNLSEQELEERELAEEKKKQEKIDEEKEDAVQKRSTKEVPVRKQSESSTGVSKQDTKGDKTTSESKDVKKDKQRKVESTLAERKLKYEQEGKQIDDAINEWNKLAKKYDFLPFEDLSEIDQDIWKDAHVAGKGNLKTAADILSKHDYYTKPELSHTSKRKAASTALVAREKAKKANELKSETKSFSDDDIIDIIAKEISEPELLTLQEQYGSKLGSESFLTDVKEDLHTYLTKGAEAVDKFIRDIIKKIANGLLAVAVFFNPSPDFTKAPQFNQTFAASVKSTQFATAPSLSPEVVRRMSNNAIVTYETLFPATKVSNAALLIADKPNGVLHVFNAKGEHVSTEPALYGKAAGDILSEKDRNTSVEKTTDVQKITPAGVYDLTLDPSPGYKGGVTLGLEDDKGSLGGIAVHAVYTGTKSEKRISRLASEDLNVKKITYGCINTTDEAFLNKILPTFKETNKAVIAVLPDKEGTLKDYITNPAAPSLPKAPRARTPSLMTRRKGLKDRGEQSYVVPDPTDADAIVDLEKRGGAVYASLADAAKEIPFLKDIEFIISETPYANNIDKIGHVVVVPTDDYVAATVAEGNGQSTLYIAKDTLSENKMRQIHSLIHEFGHVVDTNSNSDNVGFYSDKSNSDFWPRRPIYEELRAIYDGRAMIGVTKEDDAVMLEAMQEMLSYPFGPDFANENYGFFAKELFAQSFAIRHAYSDNVRNVFDKYAPKTAKFFNDLEKRIQNEPKPEEGIISKTLKNLGWKSYYRGEKPDSVSKGQVSRQNVERSGQASQTRQEQAVINRMAKATKAAAQATAKGQKAQAAPKVPSTPTLRTFNRAAKNAFYNADKARLGFMITGDVITSAEKAGVKSASDYRGAVSLKKEINSELIEPLDGIRENAEKFKASEAKEVNEFLAKSTLTRSWGFDPGIKNAIVDPNLAKEFNALTPTQQEIIKDIFKFEHSTLNSLKATINHLGNLYHANDPQGRADWDQKFKAILTLKNAAPYVPLHREGDYIVVAKSTDYENADAATKKKLKDDPDHYFVSFEDTPIEAQEQADRLKGTKKYNTVESFESLKGRQNVFDRDEIAPATKKLRAVLSGNKGLSPAEDDMINLMLDFLHDIEIKALADDTRKYELRRQNVSGFDQDVMRGVYKRGLAMAHSISNLATADATFRAMAAMKKEARTLETSKIVNELLVRHSESMKPSTTPGLIRNLLKWAGFGFLAMSPSFYLQNSMQSYMVTLPWLSGKFGYGKSAEALTTAFTDFGKQLSKERLDFSKITDKNERELLQRLVGRNLIYTGVEADLSEFRSPGERSNISESINRVSDFTTKAMNKLESINRAMSGLAAYRLARGDGKTHDAAMDLAEEAVHTTHGSYDGFNSPRYFKSDIGKVLGQFRKFQVIQMTMLANMAKDAFWGATPLDKAVARKQLTFMIGQAFFMSGLSGLPFWGLFEVLHMLLDKAFGDDEPEDLEEVIRNATGSLGLLWSRGVPAYLGVDMSGKFGFGNTFSILPYTDFNLSRAGTAEMITAATGPAIGGVGRNTLIGMGKILEGKFLEGTADILPKGPKEALKAVKQFQSGVTRPNGDVVIPAEELSTFDNVMTALGFPTTKLTERSYKQAVIDRTEKFFDERTSEIKKDYIEGYRNSDTEQMNSARDDWADMQELRTDRGFTRQPISDLLKSVVEQRKRTMRTIEGLQYRPANRRYVESIANR